MIGLSFNTTNDCTMRAPPPSTGSTRMRHSVLSGIVRVGTVRHAISRGGSTATTSLVRLHANFRTLLRPRKRAPGAAASAPSIHSASWHSWLHSPTLVGSETSRHTASGAVSVTTSTLPRFGN